MDSDIEQLLSMTTQDYRKQTDTLEPIQTDLVEVFDKSALYVQLSESKKNTYNALISCKFMEHCLVESNNLEEQKWFMMLSVLAGLGIETGMKLALEFSKYYPDFDEKKTKDKFMHAADYYPTCKHIKECFQCPEACKRHNPLHLNTSRICIDRSKNIYEVRDDGLYLGTKDGNIEDMEKICSYINPLGKICLTDNTGWGRYVEIKNSRGITSKEIIRMKDLNGTAEKAKDQLSDHGLEIENASAYKKVIDFLRTFNSSKIFTEVTQIGWYNDSFILPDQVFSHSLLENEEIVFNPGKENLITVSGTSEEWKKEIGEKCAGNDLLMFLCGYALSSTLLTPCNKEGGGIHLSGPSSSSKTTSVMVAGSMFGGNDKGGFVRSWRGTSNAFEAIAANHNDMLLVLDEIGQATPDAIFELLYMFANNQGKSRLTRNILLRKGYKWIMNFLSTGEVTLEEKIKQASKHNRENRMMAGQAVRVIDLTIPSQGVFQNLHGFASPAELSEHLKRACKKYWGTPLRDFLKALFGESYQDFDNNIKYILHKADIFKTENLPENVSGQVIRVADKFGLYAASGAFAAKHGVLPWSEEEAWDAAVLWFKIYLQERKGTGDLEIENAIRNIFAYIEKYKASRFYPLDYDNRTDSNFSGYYWNEDDRVVYFFLTDEFDKLIGNANKNQLIQNLIDRSSVEMTKNGTWMRTKWVKDHSVSGIGIIIQKESDPDKKKSKHERPVIYIDSFE